MADNFTFTEGTGKTGAADDVEGVLYQRVKLVDGTAESTTAIAAGGGVEAGALRVTIANDSTGVLSVDDGGGTLTVDGTVAVTHDALTELGSAIDTEVQCDIVGALPAGSNAIGKLAANSGVDIGDVDVLSIAAGTNNIGTVAPYAQPANFISGYTTTDCSDTTLQEVLAAQGAGVNIYLTSLLVTNGGSAGTFVKVYDGNSTTDTVKWTGYAAEDGGGFASSFPTPLGFSANTPVYAGCSTTDAASVRVSAAGYKV